MYKATCKHCKKEFESKVKNRVFCSRNCYNSGPRKSRTQEQKDKISKITKEFYSKQNIDKNKKRWESISKSKTKSFTEEELNKIKEIYSLRYIVDMKEILKRAGIVNKSTKILENYIRNNKEWYDSLNLMKFLPLKIQKLSLEDYNKFVEDSRNLTLLVFNKKYNLSKKAVYSLIDKGVLDNSIKDRNNKGFCNKKETTIERFVRNILEENYIDFKREYFQQTTYKKGYYFDFLLNNNKVIEVNGDYWHSNPKVYNENAKLTKVQKENILRDIEKSKFCENNGFELLIIWEKDIYDEPNKVKDIILEYARK